MDAPLRSYYLVIARRGVSDTFAFAKRELLVGLLFAVIAGVAEVWLDPDANLGSIVGSALMAFGLVMGLALAGNLLLAPAKLDREQRKQVAEVEAKRDSVQRELRALQEPPDIEFEVIPEVKFKMRPIPGDYDEDDTYAYDSEAIIRVRNANEEGGEKATARGVTPEIEVEGARPYVGWDWIGSRDFRPTREEHVIYVAHKVQEQNFAVATLRRPEDRRSGPIWGPSTFDVRLTLRGDNFAPKVYDFRLHTGAQGGALGWEKP